MHHDYADIRALTDAAPLWFDEHAVPRYVPFAPGLQANIYATEIVLMEIACQNCRTRFHVVMSTDRMIYALTGRPTLADQVMNKVIHYGDPPNMQCCPAGPTMNCIDLRVVEFWGRDPSDRFEWQRQPALETAIESLDDY